MCLLAVIVPQASFLLGWWHRTLLLGWNHCYYFKLPHYWKAWLEQWPNLLIWLLSISLLFPSSARLGHALDQIQHLEQSRNSKLFCIFNKYLLHIIFIILQLNIVTIVKCKPQSFHNIMFSTTKRLPYLLVVILVYISYIWALHTLEYDSEIVSISLAVARSK